MANNRTGLHKKISAIFDGVPLPSNDTSPFIPDSTEPTHIGYVPTRPPQDTPQAPFAEMSQQSPTDYRQSPPGSPKTSRLKELFQSIKNKLFPNRPDISPKRQKTIIILLPILFVVFVFTLIQTSCSNPKKQALLATSVELKKVSTIPTPKIEWSMPKQYPAELRDPTKPASATAGYADTSQLVVKGIVQGQDSSIAIISNQMVRKGDKILGATVVEINKDDVAFEMNGKTWTQKVQRSLSRR